MRQQELFRKVGFWLSLALALSFGLDFLFSGSPLAAMGTVAAVVSMIVTLVDQPAETQEEYGRRRRETLGLSLVCGVVLILLLALNAPAESRLAFAGLLVIGGLAWALWERMSHTGH
jgi:hypothetical protein